MTIRDLDFYFKSEYVVLTIIDSKCNSIIFAGPALSLVGSIWNEEIKTIYPTRYAEMEIVI